MVAVVRIVDLSVLYVGPSVAKAAVALEPGTVFCKGWQAATTIQNAKDAAWEYQRKGYEPWQ